MVPSLRSVSILSACTWHPTVFFLRAVARVAHVGFPLLGTLSSCWSHTSMTFIPYSSGLAWSCSLSSVEESSPSCRQRFLSFGWLRSWTYSKTSARSAGPKRRKGDLLSTSLLTHSGSVSSVYYTISFCMLDHKLVHVNYIVMQWIYNLTQYSPVLHCWWCWWW